MYRLTDEPRTMSTCMSVDECRRYNRLWEYETCRLPPTQMLIELARLYGVSTDYLLGVTDAVSEPSQAMWIDTRDRGPSEDDGNCFGLVLAITTIPDKPLRVVVTPWDWANPLNCNYWTWLPDLPEEYHPKLPNIGKTMEFRRMKGKTT